MVFFFFIFQERSKNSTLSGKQSVRFPSTWLHLHCTSLWFWRTPRPPSLTMSRGGIRYVFVLISKFYDLPSIVLKILRIYIILKKSMIFELFISNIFSGIPLPLVSEPATLRPPTTCSKLHESLRLAHEDGKVRAFEIESAKTGRVQKCAIHEIRDRCPGTGFWWRIIIFKFCSILL